ncbi:MAG: hypothetical protein Q9222_007449 [Ikaeria aurantiellina]
MKRLLGNIGKRNSQDSAAGDSNGDSPEATIARGIRLFCESGGPNNQGEEVLHLPVIVESAESSPAAAREAANRIRKFLSKENFQRAYVQYNAIMLVRILADNPGKTFTRNIDGKFVSTVKELLRDGRDMSVQQILRETLDSFETAKADDETLAPLREMWKKEKVKWTQRGNGNRVAPYRHQPLHIPHAQTQNQSQNYFAHNHRPRGLPPPHELAQRIEEARTSSKLLLQVVQSTPPHEVLTNELIKEFVERCQSASRSVQGYINSDDPPPDENTLLTLIETNDQISTALSRYQRSMLQARRMTGTSPSPGPGNAYRSGAGGAQEMPVNSPPNGGPYHPPSAPPMMNGSFSSPSSPPPQQQTYPDAYSNPQTQPSHQQQSYTNTDANPFDDPRHETAAQAPADFGLPPNTQATPSDQPSSSGYHAQYGTPSTTTTNYPTTRQGEGTRSSAAYGRRTETHVEDSDDDDDDDDHGRTRGGAPVQYRF